MYFDIKPSIIDNMSLEGANPCNCHLGLQPNPFYSTAWQKKNMTIGSFSQQAASLQPINKKASVKRLFKSI